MGTMEWGYEGSKVRVTDGVHPCLIQHCASTPAA
jgi:hypothetical protein